MLQLGAVFPSTRRRLAISAAVGLASGSFCWFLLHHFDQGAADFTWAVRLSRYVLAGLNPYDTPLEQYPLTAGVIAAPLAWLSPEVAGGMFYGLSSGLLAFGLTRRGYERLLVFLAYPYWAGFVTAQWGPLIMASAFLPLLLPVTLAKPQIGLPVALTHLSRRGMVACLAVILITVLAMPTWPILWYRQLGNYGHFVPLLVPPGLLLALALARFQHRDARLLFLAGVMPQRWLYDSFTLWLIPETRRELVWTVAISWCAGVWRWYHVPHSFAEVGRWTVVFIYLPMLGLVLARAILGRVTRSPLCREPAKGSLP
jgi:hypothetical protein